MFYGSCVDEFAKDGRRRICGCVDRCAGRDESVRSVQQRSLRSQLRKIGGNGQRGSDGRDLCRESDRRAGSGLYVVVGMRLQSSCPLPADPHELRSGGDCLCDLAATGRGARLFAADRVHQYVGCPCGPRDLPVCNFAPVLGLFELPRRIVPDSIKTRNRQLGSNHSRPHPPHEKCDGSSLAAFQIKEVASVPTTALNYVRRDPSPLESLLPARTFRIK